MEPKTAPESQLFEVTEQVANQPAVSSWRLWASFVVLGSLLITLSLLAFLAEGKQEPVDFIDYAASNKAAADGTVARLPVEDAERDSSLGADAEATMDSVLEIARQSLEQLRSNVRDYRGTLVKRERVGGALGGESSMAIKVRNPSEHKGKTRSLSAYLRFESPRMSAGREVIWSADQNEGKLVSHEGGFKNWTRMNLAPDSQLAMLGNKYPITEIGLIRLVEKLIEKGERDRLNGSPQIAVIPGQQVGDRACTLIEVKHPEALPGLDFHIARVFIDDAWQIPLRYSAYLWPKAEGETPPLEEEYTYLDLELNVGLSDEDFDPDNPAYDFP